MNIQFKEERRQIESLNAYGQISTEYWQICEMFLQLIEIKQSENLRKLAQTNQPDKVMENIKTEIDCYLHQQIGLGKRMPIPDSLDVKTAKGYQKQLMSRVIEIYGKNQRYGDENERLLKVS